MPTVGCHKQRDKYIETEKVKAMEEKSFLRSRLDPDLTIDDLVIPEELTVYSFDRDAVEREIQEIRLRNSVIEKVDTIGNGDFIEIIVSESGKRFPATAGLGLLGDATERALLGMSVGDSLIPADGAFVGKKVSVHSVKRRILPEFSDQDAVALGYVSASDYRRQRFEELRDQARRAKARELVQEACISRVSQAILIPWETELEDLARDYQSMNEEMFRSRKIDILSADSDELEQAFGVRSVEELNEKTLDNAEQNLKMAVIGQKIAVERGAILDEPEYERRVCALAEKYLMDEDAVRKNSSFKTIMVEKYVKLLFSEQIARTEAAMREV